MSNKKVPDAWDDDDWEAKADNAVQEEETRQPAAQPPKTKAERLAEHREINRKIWQEAEEPAPLPYHVAAAPSAPFTQGFRQPMKLLSRKPVTKTIDPVTGLARLTVEDVDDDEGDKKPQPTAAEIEEQRKRELEKKNRDYEERRAKLFGTPPKETTSGTSTPGTTTPPLVGDGGGGGGGNGRGSHRGRGRGRGGRGGRGGQRNNDGYRNERNDNGHEAQERRPGYNGGGRGGQRNDSFRNERRDRNERDEVRNDSQERISGIASGSPYRELFDPDASSKPSPRPPQRGSSTSSPTRGPESAIRRPRIPDNSGRGGFGFANRGSKEG